MLFGTAAATGAVALLALLQGAQAAGTATISANGLSFDTNTNVTVTSGQEGEFTFRHNSLLLVESWLMYTSIKADVQLDGNGGASGQVDGIVGAAVFPSGGLLSMLNFPPTAMMAYFEAEASASQASSGNTINVDASASIVASVYSMVEEVSSSGAVVKTYALKNLDWSNGGVKASGPNGELKYVTYTTAKDGFTASITLAVSSVLAKLNVGSATITPKSMEAFFEMEGYNYASAGNSLRLTLYLGQASAHRSKTYTSTNTIIAGSGSDQVYFHLAGEAVIDGQVRDVTVSGLTEINIDIGELDNNILKGQLTSKGSDSYEIRKVSIGFPAGASSISYDPAMGFSAPDSASFLAPSALLLAAIVALAAFFQY